jgi:hypothetical protein
METTVEIFQFIAVCSAGILAGGQLFALLAVIPALPAFPHDTSAYIHQEALSERPHRYLRVVAVVTTLSTLVALLIEWDLVQTSMILMLVGMLLTILNGALSSLEWPINHEIDSWGKGQVPPEYASLRERWDRQHVWRTIASQIALACFVIAALLY